MNTYKFMGAFAPLATIAIHSAIQIYVNDMVLDTTVLKAVLLGLFVFGVVAFLSPYNIIVFSTSVAIVTVAGVYLTTPEMIQYAVEYIRTQRGK